MWDTRKEQRKQDLPFLIVCRKCWDEMTKKNPLLVGEGEYIEYAQIRWSPKSCWWGPSGHVLRARKITCVLGPLLERALPGFCEVMEQGLKLKNTWVSCTGRKDNPRDVWLAEV